MSDDQLDPTRMVMLADLDPSLRNDGEFPGYAANLRQRIARSIGADTPKPTHALDLPGSSTGNICSLRVSMMDLVNMNLLFANSLGWRSVVHPK